MEKCDNKPWKSRIKLDASLCGLITIGDLAEHDDVKKMREVRGKIFTEKFAPRIKHPDGANAIAAQSNCQTENRTINEQ